MSMDQNLTARLVAEYLHSLIFVSTPHASERLQFPLLTFISLSNPFEKRYIDDLKLNRTATPKTNVPDILLELAAAMKIFK